jgi:FixJ family two-component response regulator
MTETESIVFIVDDDAHVRDSLGFLLRSAGFQAQGFASAEEFLAGYDARQAGCVVLDVRMSGMSGLDLQQEMSARGMPLPVIIVTGYADVPTVVRAVKSGAVDVLEKPYDEHTLLDRVRTAIETDRRHRFEGDQLSARMASLSDRQREVMRMLLAGKGTKEIARDLGISPKTVEKHRTSVLVKMRTESVVDLMRLVLTTRA